MMSVNGTVLCALTASHSPHPILPAFNPSHMASDVQISLDPIFFLWKENHFALHNTHWVLASGRKTTTASHRDTSFNSHKIIGLSIDYVIWHILSNLILPTPAVIGTISQKQKFKKKNVAWSNKWHPRCRMLLSMESGLKVGPAVHASSTALSPGSPLGGSGPPKPFPVLFSPPSRAVPVHTMS